jgi:hypothetical protein
MPGVVASPSSRGTSASVTPLLNCTGADLQRLAVGCGFGIEQRHLLPRSPIAEQPEVSVSSLDWLVAAAACQQWGSGGLALLQLALAKPPRIARQSWNSACSPRLMPSSRLSPSSPAAQYSRGPARLRIPELGLFTSAAAMLPTAPHHPI